MNNRIKQIAEYLSICIRGKKLYYYQGNAKNCQRRFKIKLNTERNKSLNVNYYKIIFKSLLLFIVAGMMLLFNAGPANAESSINSSTANAAAATNANTKKTIKIAKITTSSAYSSAQKQLKKISGKFTKKHIFKSSQAEHVVSKKQIKAIASLGGGIANALVMSPGVNVNAVSGAAGGSMGRDAVVINGVKAAYPWRGGQDLANNAISFLFDGVPMMYLGASYDSHFDTMELPFANFFQGINVINGPGNPNSRWFDSLGGTVNFVPVQPTTNMYDKVNMSYGSYDTYTLDDEISTGMHDGWDAVMAAGYTHTDTFLNTDYNAPDHAYAFYGKVVKLFNHNSFSLGAYAVRYKDYAFSEGTPVNPVPGVNTVGYGIPNAPLYSQQTSGFYSQLSQYNWEKYVTNQVLLTYSKLDLNLTKRLQLHSMIWYMHADRYHYMLDHYGDTAEGLASGFGMAEEYYNVPTNIIGEKLSFDYHILKNNIKLGEYYIWSTMADLYDGSEGQTVAPFYPNNTLDYGAFNANLRYSSIYLQDAIKSIKNLTITPAIDYVGFQNQYINDAAYIYYPYYINGPEHYDDSAFTPAEAKNYYELEPSIGLNYKLNKNISLFGNWSVAYQNPNDRSFQPEYHSGTKPVRSEGFEAGIRFLIRRNLYLRHFVLNANYFQTIFSNENISNAVSTVNQGFIFYSSLAKNLDRGVNIDASDNPIRNLHLYTNISLNDSHIISYSTAGTSYNNYSDPNTPYTVFNVGAYYNIPVNNNIYSLKLWDNYNGSQYIWSYAVGAGEPTYTSMPAFNLVNASIGMKTTMLNNYLPGLKMTKITLSVSNLLNKHYNSMETYNAGGSGKNIYNYYQTPSSGILQGWQGAPREIFLSASLMF
jgi:iron complex outermembrane receptor protein